MVAEQEELRSRTEPVYWEHPRWAGAEWGQKMLGQKRLEGLNEEPERWQVELGIKKRRRENHEITQHQLPPVFIFN